MDVNCLALCCLDAGFRSRSARSAVRVNDASVKSTHTHTHTHTHTNQNTKAPQLENCNMTIKLLVAMFQFYHVGYLLVTK